MVLVYINRPKSVQELLNQGSPLIPQKISYEKLHNQTLPLLVARQRYGYESEMAQVMISHIKAKHGL